MNETTNDDVAFVMRTKRGVTYWLDVDGYVLARSDGPPCWNYAKGWRIIGLAKRYHSATVTPVAVAADMPDVPGWGVVHDWDHGYRRTWDSDRAVSIERVTR